METLTIKVNNSKTLRLLEDLEALNLIQVIGHSNAFVEKRGTSPKKKLLEDIDDAVDFINEYKKGRAKAKSFNQLMDEL
ncbi:MAG: hypothetical protein JSS93_05435 [Bacteroidetes bacterium]|nr:hypothetical protein [Bacteroidota bacterium]